LSTAISESAMKPTAAEIEKGIREPHLSVLHLAATEADIGLINSGDGFLLAYSGSIERMRDFARSLAAPRADFRQLRFRRPKSSKAPPENEIAMSFHRGIGSCQTAKAARILNSSPCASLLAAPVQGDRVQPRIAWELRSNDGYMLSGSSICLPDDRVRAARSTLQDAQFAGLSRDHVSSSRVCPGMRN
jgi:hypothetical protein